jgi:hypothetical protein
MLVYDITCNMYYVYNNYILYITCNKYLYDKTNFEIRTAR